jgi:protein-tyrosine-phosphatase/predicted ATP-grasp superfamily ATP-dependent carboligase
MSRKTIQPRTILVTDAHALAGLGAIRSLGRAGYTVIAGYPDMRRAPPAVSSRYCAGAVRYPDPWMFQFAFRDWLVAQCRLGVFDTVLPVAEATVFAAGAVRSDLPTHVLAMLPSDRALAFSLSKYRATAKALAAGIPAPRTIFVQDGTPPSSWQDDLSSLKFPVIVKTDNHLASDGVYVKGRRFTAPRPEDAAAILQEYKGKPIALLVQELIPGTGAGVFLLRFGGAIHLAFAHRRLHEVPYWGGYSSFRESCSDPPLTALGAAMLDATDHDGVAMVEFRHSSVDGQPYFLEINGRLWGSLALALRAGADFPRALIECYECGRPAPQASYRNGIRCRNVFPGEVKHLSSILTAKGATHGGAVPSKIAAIAKFVALSLNPTIHHDHFWLTDPLPGLANAVRAIRWLGGESRALILSKIRRYRERRMLDLLKERHLARSNHERYFPRPLSRVAFVCYGNICRSAFAEHYWNKCLRELARSAPEAISAGVHPEPNRRTPPRFIEIARRYDVDLSHHRSHILDPDALASCDAIFVMDRRNYHDVLVRFPWTEDRMYFLGWFGNGYEIKDPYNMPGEDAASLLHEIVQSVDGLVRRLSSVAHVDAATVVRADQHGSRLQDHPSSTI